MNHSYLTIRLIILTDIYQSTFQEINFINVSVQGIIIIQKKFKLILILYIYLMEEHQVGKNKYNI